jgi:hypothetical protein
VPILAAAFGDVILHRGGRLAALEVGSGKVDHSSPNVDLVPVTETTSTNGPLFKPTANRWGDAGAEGLAAERTRCGPCRLYPINR